MSGQMIPGEVFCFGCRMLGMSNLDERREAAMQEIV
jgi:hypothetical protein